LTTAYYSDRWKSLLKELNNGIEDHTTEPMKPTNIWNPQPAVEHENKHQTEIQTLTPKQLTQIMYASARRDTFDNIGRITPTELNEIGLSIEEAINLWTEQYPKFEIENRSNCLLIFWNTKAETRSQRDLQKTIQPTEPQIAAPEGDIIDETYDEQAPLVKE
jgi:hypothetical protein